MGGFGSELATLQERIASLGESQEAQTKSMRGLSRGLEDTYRHVVLGESGMLPPKVPVLETRPSSALSLLSDVMLTPKAIAPTLDARPSSASASSPHRPAGRAPPSARRPATAGATRMPERMC